jgi:DHA2 family multidrug resistance protein-like MFS transporter
MEVRMAENMRSGAVETLRAGRREWIGLAVIALPCLLYSMDLTVLNLAVPALSADLRPGASQLLWIIDIYGFLIAGSLITMGTLGDRIGRRKLLMIGAAAFGAASVLAALSKSAGMLIAARALLGISGATFAPSTLSLIRNMFHDPKERTVAVSVWVTSYSVGAAIGPLLGGLVLQRFPWSAVFLLAVPFMALLLTLGPRLLPEYRDPRAGCLDLTSAALSLCAVLAVIYGLKKIAENGFGAVPVFSILAGIAAAAVFLRRQAHLEDPLIDLRLFQAPAFSASLVTYMLSCFTAFGVYIFIAQYLQLVMGLSPFQAGLWTLPWSLGFVVGSTLAPLFVRRYRPATVMVAGLAVAAFGFVLLARAEATSGLAAIVAGSTVFSLGLAPVITLANDIIIGAAPPERAGAAAGISETTAELGGALGIAILGSVGTVVYRNGMAKSAIPGVPPEAWETARGTLGGAAAVAHSLPDPVGPALLEASRDAFTRGFRLTSWINAVVTAALAVLAGFLLRREKADAPPDAKLRAAGAAS